ncbi:MAG: ATP-dependent protease ATPase subunit HslU [Armatimonadota bacterium]|nr:ATP-dependent protease ATPase subunit HslU [Armatimonadota bacterium]MDR7429819.1 ATP-dependent protease ATPase subunit HslU [Armatimonadota bacterium]MDR7476570.1 ATP-dependent protease ATPase subunit HslU [Armatimonadota bacterium]MDR7514337.1 ATP-dependent protease ATPase subunit HslU [Armatimonadota bacterium]MDR7540955.1 ATP-dependent protease ATPase subunit HslU [Armatimonadota bacterium]
MEELTPRRIVAELDKHIVGQEAAKRAVAVALRNRYRRSLLPEPLRRDVIPKNILMIGPTGVGKTEIARRVARLVDAPFVKVEATKFTEVGYVGRDVDSMIRDLVEVSVQMVKQERIRAVQPEAERLARERMLRILVPDPPRPAFSNPLEALLGRTSTVPESSYGREQQEVEERRRLLRPRLEAGELDREVVEVEVEEQTFPTIELIGAQGVEEMGINLQDLLGGLLPKRRKRRRVTVAEGLRILVQEEASKLIDHEEAQREGVRRAEELGIVFIDEIDKIAGSGPSVGPDVSREGVQRDLLPIVEGCTVTTRYGPVRTDHVLFLCAGAFHSSKPSDLIPELQGRLPIRVELERLTPRDFVRILTEPENSLTKQVQALLATEGVEVVFTPDGVEAIARIAHEINERTEDIGARRLHTVLERVTEEISFEAPEGPRQVVIDEAYVRRRLEPFLRDRDLSRYIL